MSSKFEAFYANFNTESNDSFKESFTIEELKQEEQNAPIYIDPSKTKKHKSGNKLCFFSCGRVRGMVAEKLSQKLMAPADKREHIGTIVISHVVNENYDGLIMHEQTRGSISVF